MYAMDKRVHGSVLSDILVTAGLIAEGSVDQALRGKHYKRGIIYLHLINEALMRKLVQQSIESGSSLSEDIKVHLDILQDSSIQSIHSECCKEEFSRLKNSESSMAKYWKSFLEMTEILMMNLHSLRTQN